jgi:hypothetical protein
MSQKKQLTSAIQQIQTLLEKKGELTPHPENNAEVVVIKETQINEKYTVSIAVGKVSAISNRYFDVRGQVFDDSFNRFSENSLRIEPKQIMTTKGVQYFCFVFQPGLVRAVDEVTWAEKFVTIEDLINVLENLGNQDSFSFFTAD